MLRLKDITEQSIQYKNGYLNEKIMELEELEYYYITLLYIWSSAYWRLYVSINLILLSSDNGLSSHVQRQVTIWKNMAYCK